MSPEQNQNPSSAPQPNQRSGGAPVPPTAPLPTPHNVAPGAVPIELQPPGPESASKDYVVAVLLSFFVGSYGVDRFYLGRIGTGVLKLVTLGGLGVWAFIDVILIVWGKMKDSEGKPLRGYAENQKTMKLIFIILTIAQVALLVGWLILTMFILHSNIQQKADDAFARSNVNMLGTQLEAYYTVNQTYPSYAQLSDSGWRADHLPSVDKDVFQNGKGQELMLNDNLNGSSQDYAYVVGPAGCAGTAVSPCLSFTLEAPSHDGMPSEVKSQHD